MASKKKAKAQAKKISETIKKQNRIIEAQNATINGYSTQPSVAAPSIPIIDAPPPLVIPASTPQVLSDGTQAAVNQAAANPYGNYEQMEQQRLAQVALQNQLIAEQTANQQRVAQQQLEAYQAQQRAEEARRVEEAAALERQRIAQEEQLAREKAERERQELLAAQSDRDRTTEVVKQQRTNEGRTASSRRARSNASLIYTSSEAGR